MQNFHDADFAGNQTTGRDPMRVLLIVAQVALGLVFAFFLGRLTAPRHATPLPAIVSTDAAVDPQAAIIAAGNAEEVRQLESQVKGLKQDNAELLKDKSELQRKLSAAADSMNKARLNMDALRRRAEDAEWRARQTTTATTAATLPGTTP